TLSVKARGKDPSHFRDALNRRVDFTFPVGEAHLAHKLAGELLFDHPVTETHPGPMADVAKDSGPNFFFGERFAANEPRDEGIRPKREGIAEICRTVTAQAETFGFDDGHFPARQNGAVMPPPEGTKTRRTRDESLQGSGISWNLKGES